MFGQLLLLSKQTKQGCRCPDVIFGNGLDLQLGSLFSVPKKTERKKHSRSAYFLMSISPSCSMRLRTFTSKNNQPINQNFLPKKKMQKKKCVLWEDCLKKKSIHPTLRHSTACPVEWWQRGQPHHAIRDASLLNMTGLHPWMENPPIFNRKCIDSFMVDFPAIVMLLFGGGGGHSEIPNAASGFRTSRHVFRHAKAETPKITTQKRPKRSILQHPD